MARIITITSGKGGVGKTGISLNLSLSLASKGYKVCLFDADLGLANVNILTGIYPKKDLVCVIEGEQTLDDIMIKNYQGIDIIPGSSGVERLADLSGEQGQRLIKAFLALKDYDYFIFDTSAGISSQVLSFCMASHEIILVATCEPTSITDAYSMLKVLSLKGYSNPVKVIINQVKKGKAAKKAYAQLKETVNRFLKIKLSPLGIVGWDRNVRVSVISQTPFFMLFPETLASKCIRTLTQKLVSKKDAMDDIPLELFWDNCLKYFKKHKTADNTQIETPQPEPTKPPTVQTPEPVKRSAPTINDTPAETQAALARIEITLAELTDQVAQIKQMLAPSSSSTEQVSKIPEKQEIPTAKEIRLDFESWLDEHRQQSL